MPTRQAFPLKLAEARASLSRGEGREITEQSMRSYAEEIKAHGRARLRNELHQDNAMPPIGVPPAEAGVVDDDAVSAPIKV